MVNCDLLRLVKCIMNLSDLEVLIYKHLLNLEDATVRELSVATGYSRPAIQKALLKLLNNGLVTRKRALRSGGGFIYVYKAVPLEKLRDECLRIVMERFKRGSLKLRA